MTASLHTCDLTFTVDVDYSVRRPVIPDERSSTVTILAPDDADAVGTAVCMVAGRRGVEMVTSARVTDCVA